MTEAALIASRKSKLKFMADAGNEGAKLAHHIAEKPGGFLSTIQVGITFIAIFTGAISEEGFMQQVTAVVREIPFIQVFSVQISFVLVIGIITFISILFGELIPKRIALSNPERIISLVIPLLNMFSQITYPLVRILTVSTEFIIKMLKLKSTSGTPITEEEVRILIREGTDMGIFNKTEKKLVERALQLDDLMVKTLMTPKDRIQYIDLDEFPKDPKKFVSSYQHSRALFTRGGIDNVVGVIHVDELLKHFVARDSVSIEEVMSKPLFVPENTRALKVLEIFRRSPIHIALVLNEFGHISGLITINDILEALVGEIRSQSSQPIIYTKQPDGSIILDGMTQVSKVKDLLQVEELPETNGGGYQTIGGFLMSRLDRVPKIGDMITVHGYRFEVLSMENQRVGNILITKFHVHTPP